MAYYERDYQRGSGGGGGDYFRRILTWMNDSVSIGIYFDINVRVANMWFVFVPLWVWMWSGGGDSLANGFGRGIQSVAVVFLSVLLHEFGHSFGCRYVGGSSNRILLWPLGGLAYCDPPHHPWGYFVTVICGPLVNVVIAVLAYCTLWGFYESVSLLPFGMQESFYYNGYVFQLLLLDFYTINVALLLFNLLLVFYPFDGGRIIHAVVWWFTDYKRSMKFALVCGMIGAILAALYGLYTIGQFGQGLMLVMIAVFGFTTCYQQYQAFRYAGPEVTGEAFGGSGQGYTSYGGYEPPRENPFQKWSRQRKDTAARKQAQQRAKLDAEVDRILDKVKRDGLQSLDSREKRILQQASEQKRR